MTGAFQGFTELVQLIEVRTDDQGRCAYVLVEDGLHDGDLGVRRRAELVALLGFGDGVRHPFGIGESDPNLDALGGRDPALRLDVLPRCVVALGSDEREDVPLPAVLAHQRGGEPEPAA